jgi:hypothetical protein
VFPSHFDLRLRHAVHADDTHRRFGARPPPEASCTLSRALLAGRPVVFGGEDGEEAEVGGGCACIRERARGRVYCGE